MRYLMSAAAMLALVGFIGFTDAADTKPTKPKPAHFVKLEGKELTVIGGAKGKGKQRVVAIDDSTKFTIDGKDVPAAEAAKQLKADEYLEITEVKNVATLVAASTTPPAPKTKPSDAPKTGDTAPKAPDPKAPAK